ncbi:DNA helicase MCM9-like [Gordionus sp. m RMFG-2023]|uniref:DNA helicase MCM9-like n=1 Tax=Gordionus sp. m RMFG-2023 TaxID=3053472 RepID=UPI0031FCCCED
MNVERERGCLNFLEIFAKIRELNECDIFYDNSKPDRLESSREYLDRLKGCGSGLNSELISVQFMINCRDEKLKARLLEENTTDRNIIYDIVVKFQSIEITNNKTCEEKNSWRRDDGAEWQGSLAWKENKHDNKICGTSMSNRPDTMKADDYQEIKIQERTQSSTFTGKKLSRSRTCKVVLRGSSLVDSCKVGDDVTINGVLRLRYYFDPRAATESGIEMETVFVANHVTVDNEISNEFTHSLTYAPLQMKNVIGGLQLPDQAENEFIHFWKMNSDTPFKARDSLLSGICPHIFGAYAIKLALALVLAGGIEINNAHVNVNRVRGRCHCLLIGDEGTGKSQFLKFASKILPRSIYTNALNVSHAGLTVTAVRSSECSPRDSLSGGWALEAGLLVLTDGGGALCLESIDSLKGSDLTALHETMEQQTISVAKAGIVCKLSSKSSIIASITPAQRYESNQTLTNSLAISKALLSRFDLVFLLKDRCFDVSWDTSVANHVLNGYLTPSNTSEACEAWSLEKVQNYFLYIKNARPVVTQQSQSLLSKYYCFHRKRENDTKLNSFGSSRSTIRMLESLIRLSQAHAKLMLHQRVEIEDAISVIALMEYSLQSTLKDTNPYNLSDANDGNYLIPFHYFDAFPSDADDHYKNIKDIILSKI